MKNPQENISKLNKLRNLGIEIAIDDFGAGYSSLSYLAEIIEASWLSSGE